jgi:hypothetical protein
MPKTKLREWAEGKYGEKKVLGKIQVIIDMTKPDNKKTFDLQTAQNITLNRLKMLLSSDLNIEYINTGSSLVEYAIKRIIESHEFLINSSLVLGDFDTKLKVSAEVNGGNQTLGALIKELARFCSEPKLRDMLGKFNSKRKKATHQIYVEHKDINKVNEELREYTRTNPIFEIIKALSDTHGILVADLTAKIKEYGFIAIDQPNI